MSKVPLRFLKQFSSVRVLVVGDLIADHYVFGQTERMSREAPVLVVRHERDEITLGGAANAAANARSLGGNVHVVGVLGRDEMGRRMKRLFHEVGIHVDSAAGAGVHTETKTRVLAGGVSTTRQQMLRIDRGTSGDLPSIVRRRLAHMVDEGARNADVVIVSDYGAGVLSSEVRKILLKHARSGLSVCVDSRFELRQFEGFSVCKPNEPELAALTAMPISSDAQVREAAEKAHAMLNCETLLVTRGRQGMLVVEKSGRTTAIGVHGHADAVDVTGAGDTVHATMALAIGAHASPIDAAALANVAGSIVVQKQGTAIVTPNEIRKAVRS